MISELLFESDFVNDVQVVVARARRQISPRRSAVFSGQSERQRVANMVENVPAFFQGCNFVVADPMDVFALHGPGL